MTDIRMPKLANGATEGKITKWLKDIGNPVATGDILFRVMDGDASQPVDVKSETTGTLKSILVLAGHSAAPGTVCGTFA